MASREATIEIFIDRLKGNEALNSGQKVMVEGCFEDSTLRAGCLATILKRELPADVRVIKFGAFLYRRWPEETSVGEVADLDYQDFGYFNRSDFPGIRAFILEDGRVFVREKEYQEVMYRSRILVPAIEIALERFGQCRGAGTFMMLVGQQGQL